MSRRAARLGVLALLALAPMAAAAPTPSGPTPSRPAPSALVTTETPRRGVLPATVTGYGTARPAPGASVALAVQHAGEIARLDVTQGETVAKGAPLLTIAAAPAVVAQLRQARTALALARGERAHTAQLRAQHLATQDQLAQADRAVADATATLEALRREGGGVPVQVLRAPFAGFVAAVAVTQGQLVAANAPLLTLNRQGGLVVTVGIDPAAQAQLRPGQPARLIPLGGGATLAGTVRVVSAMIDPRTHLVDTVIDVRAGDPLGGESYRAVIRVGEHAGWIVPRDAVLTDAEGPAVFQVARGHAVRVGVRVLGEHGARSVVAGPVDPKRPLVTTGNYQLSPGMAVRLAPSPASAPSPTAR